MRRALANEGIPFDRKRFCPHITLARKPFVPERAALSEIRVPSASMTVEDVCLYRSDRGKNGMAYTVIGRSPEAGAAKPCVSRVSGQTKNKHIPGRSWHGDCFI